VDGAPAAGRLLEDGAMTDPAGLQVLAAALRGVAEEMGAALVRSAHSANIKERRDCSTAVFDSAGRMIAQAEHLPVHLGAMPDAVAAVLASGARRGEVWAINDPYTGGTHLPDITLVAVVDDLGIVCSRAHHADVGGMQPASMPAGATELLQEGVVIPPLRLTGDVRALLVANMRKPAERLADLRAQEACMAVGADRLRQLTERFGRRTLLAGMDELHAYSERRIRAGIRRIPDGSYEAEDVVEGDGTHTGDIPIRVRVTVKGDRVRADFEGTAAQQPGNVNCPIAVTRSAVYFCVRAVCGPDIPASGGAFVPVEVVAPDGCLVNARPPGAVVGGNTETSSRIVDVVMSALGKAVPVPAHGQGTMNNVTFGTPGFTYYETLGGGQGGGPAGPGPSAVHVAMSNTLNTPIEALEREYPLRIERYALRPRTGGAGVHRGGDGVVRVYRVLADCRLGLMTERRRHGPRGAAGGEDGAPGQNRLNGRRLPAKCSLDLKAGDVLEIRTPGGGGWGKPPP
jgi:N-methylhydantoinase B